MPNTNQLRMYQNNLTLSVVSAGECIVLAIPEYRWSKCRWSRQCEYSIQYCALSILVNFSSLLHFHFLPQLLLWIVGFGWRCNRIKYFHLIKLSVCSSCKMHCFVSLLIGSFQRCSGLPLLFLPSTTKSNTFLVTSLSLLQTHDILTFSSSPLPCCLNYFPVVSNTCLLSHTF